MKMKRIYFYGRFTRLFAILPFLMFIGIAVFGLFPKGAQYAPLPPNQVWLMIVLIVVSSAGLLYTVRRMYTYRILIDTEADRICFIWGMDKRHRYDRQFSRIESIEPVKEKGHFYFLITHMSGMQEKLTYETHRYNSVELMQYRRLSRAVKKIMTEKTSDE